MEQNLEHKIYLYPSRVLRQSAEPIRGERDAVRALSESMIKTMRAAHGVGLAAPQVGVGRRVVVIDCSRQDQQTELYPLVMLNPELVATSQQQETQPEGCLSVPGETAEVKRHTSCTCRYQTLAGEDLTIEASGLLSICIQHELDHLDGVLFFDRLSHLKRRMLLRRYNKRRKAEEFEPEWLYQIESV